jgi:hypothetical protein
MQGKAANVKALPIAGSPTRERGKTLIMLPKIPSLTLRASSSHSSTKN